MRAASSKIQSVSRLKLCCATAVLLAICCAASWPGEAGADKRATFTLPPGFEVECVAAPPLVERPIMAGFDERGRLFVADSAGVNLKAEDLVKDPPHSIRMLEDTDGDGIFDRSTVFADKLAFPMGVLCYRGSVYTCSPPSLWKLTDTDGDGVADKREEIVTKFGSSGNAADIHGPFLGPDGWIYWADGRHGHEIARPDGTLLRGKAARIFRARPDGSGVEALCGGGMDNPVELAFTPEGEALATVALLYAQPKRIDGIIHCVEGGAFPWNDVVREFRRTGDLLPAVTHLGWVAPSGFMRYQSTAFSTPSQGGEGVISPPSQGGVWGVADYRDMFFTALFNVHKIQHHRIEREGATFKSRDADFLVSSDPDAHFTDVLEDADGSLLVLDTGGWFRIGCPNSRVAKPDIKGAIYRIKRTGAPKVEDPRGLKIAWKDLSAPDLAKLLDDERFAVRERAIEELAQRAGTPAPPVLDALKHVLQQSSPRARRNAVWTLSRIVTGEVGGDARPTDSGARELIRTAMSDNDAGVRQAAVHVAGLHRDGAALAKLMELVKTDVPPIKREAATALGRLHDPAAVPALLEGLRMGARGDRFLEHALIYALMECSNSAALMQALRSDSALVRRAALIALDQTGDTGLTPEVLAPLLDPAEPVLQQAALKVIQAREGWGRQVLSLVRQWLDAKELTAAQRENLCGTLVAFCREAAIQDAVAVALRSPQTATATRLAVLEALARAPLETLPATWTAELRWALDHSDAQVVRQALAAMRARNVLEFPDASLRLAADEQRPAELRAEAAALAAPRITSLDAALFGFLTSCLNVDQHPLLRMTAAEALGSAPLSDAQLASLCKNVETAGALELSRLMAAFERGKKEELGKRLLKSISSAQSFKSLTPESLTLASRNFPPAVQKEFEALAQKLDAAPEEQMARLAELSGLLAGGNAERGRAVFFGARATCAACHNVPQSSGVVGRVGPDLSKIGEIRAERDLLESIVFPSNSFARGYEVFVIKTTEGAVFNGIIARETPDAIYLYGTDRVEKRFARAAIAEMKPGKVSIMPQGLEAALSRQELADLIAYLKSLK